MNRQTIAGRAERVLALFCALVLLAELIPGFQPKAAAADALSGKTRLVLWSYMDNMDERSDHIRNGDRIMLIDAGNAALPFFTGTENSYDGSTHSYPGTALRDASRRPTSVGKNIVDSVLHGYNFVTDSGLNTPFLEKAGRTTPSLPLTLAVPDLVGKEHDTIPVWRMYLSNNNNGRTSAGFSIYNNLLSRVYESLSQRNAPWYISSVPYGKLNDDSKKSVQNGLGSVGGSSSVEVFHLAAQGSSVSLDCLTSMEGSSRFANTLNSNWAIGKNSNINIKKKSATMICYVGQEYDCSVLRSYTVPKDQTQVIGENFCYIPQNEVLRVASGGLLSVSGVIFNDGRIIIEPGGLLVVKEGAAILPLNPLNPGGGITSGGNIVMRKNALLCGGGTNGIYLSGGSVVNYGMLVSENFTISNPHTVDNREGGVVVAGKTLGPKGRGVTVNILGKEDSIRSMKEQLEYQLSLDDQGWIDYYTDLWYELHPVWTEAIEVPKPKRSFWQKVAAVVYPPYGVALLVEDAITRIVNGKKYVIVEHRAEPVIPKQSEIIAEMRTKIENMERNRAPDAAWAYPDGFGTDGSNYYRYQKSAVVRLAENAVFNDASGLINYGSFKDDEYEADTVKVSISTDGGQTYNEYWTAQLKDTSYAQSAQAVTYNMLDLWKQDSSIWAKYQQYGDQADARALEDIRKQGYGETINLHDAQFYISGYPSTTIPGNWYMRVELGSEVLLPGEMAAKVTSIRKIPMAKVTDSSKDPMEQYNFEIAYMYKGKDSGFVLDVAASGAEGFMQEGQSVQIWSRKQYDKDGKAITDITDPDQVAVKQNDNQQWRLQKAGTGERDGQTVDAYYIMSSPSGKALTLDPETRQFVQKSIARTEDGEPADDNQVFYFIPQEADMEYFLTPKSAEEGEYLSIVGANKDGTRPELASIWDMKDGTTAEEKRKQIIDRWCTFRFNIIENGFKTSKSENLDGQVFEIEQYKSNENNKVLQVYGGASQLAKAVISSFHLQENVAFNVYKRTGQANQRFRFQEVDREVLEDGTERVYYYIISTASGLLLTEIPKSSPKVGAGYSIGGDIRQKSKGSVAQDRQLWYVEQDDTGGLVRIRCKASGQSLFVDTSSTLDYVATATTYDRWRLNPVVSSEAEDALKSYTFQIAMNGSGNLVLEAAGDGTETGVNLTLNAPDQTAKQEFSFDYAGVADLNGTQRPYYYVHTAASEQVVEASGSTVLQGVRRSFPDDNQLWFLVPRLEAGEYSIVNKGSGQYLSASASSGSAASLSSTASVSWVLTKTAVKDSEDLRNGVFEFEYLWDADGTDNKVMDVSGGTTTNHLKSGSEVFLSSGHGGGNQQWRLEKAGSGEAAGMQASYYYIISSASNLALTYENGKVVQRPKSADNQGQQWYMIPQDVEGQYRIMQKADKDRYLGASSNESRAQLVRAEGEDIDNLCKGCRWRLNPVKNPIRATPPAETLDEGLYMIHSYRAATGDGSVNVLDVDQKSMDSGGRIIVHEAKAGVNAANQEFVFEQVGTDTLTGVERPYFYIYAYHSRLNVTLQTGGNPKTLFQRDKNLDSDGRPVDYSQLWYIIPDETGVFCSIVSRYTVREANGTKTWYYLKDEGAAKTVTGKNVNASPYDELKADIDCLWRLNPMTLESEAIPHIEEYGFKVEPKPTHWGLAVEEFGSGDSADIYFRTSTGQANQQFHFIRAGETVLNGTKRPYYYIKAHISKQVWTVDDRDFVDLEPADTYNENQYWVPIPRATPGEVYLMNLGTRKYMAWQRAGIDGALRVKAEEDEKPVWVLSAISVGRQDDLDGNVYTFTNTSAEGKSMDVSGGNSLAHLKSGRGVLMYDSDLRANQQWRLDKAGDGTYNGKNAPYYYVVSLPSGNALTAGTDGVSMKPKSGDDKQLWYVIPGDNVGEYVLYSKANTGSLLSIDGTNVVTGTGSSIWNLAAVPAKNLFVPSETPERVQERVNANTKAGPVYRMESYPDAVIADNPYLNVNSGDGGAFLNEGSDLITFSATGDVNQQFQFEYVGTDTVDGVQRPYYYVKPYFFKDSVQVDYCLTADTDDYVRQYAKRTPVDRSQQWYLIPDETGNFVYLRSRKNVTGGEVRYLAIENGRAKVVQFNPGKEAVSDKAAHLRLFFIEYPLKVSQNPDIAKMATNPSDDSTSTNTSTNTNANADSTIQDSFGGIAGSQGAAAVGSR